MRFLLLLNGVSQPSAFTLATASAGVVGTIVASDPDAGASLQFSISAASNIGAGTAISVRGPCMRQ